MEIIPTTNNQKTENVNVEEEWKEKYWVDNNPQLKELLCYPRENYESKYSLANNQGINKLLEISPELKLDPRYFKLRELLEAKKWEEADEETFNVMLKVADHEKQAWLFGNDINNFPCEDLRIIDHLWVKYSNDFWGFSVQKKFYKSPGGTEEREKVWLDFCDRIGWRKDEEWKTYSALVKKDSPNGKFSPNVDTKGQMPAFWLKSGEKGWGVVGTSKKWGRAHVCELLTRAKACNL